MRTLRSFFLFFLAFFAITTNAADTLSPIGLKSFQFTDTARNKKISVLMWYPTHTKNHAVIPKGIWQQEASVPDAPINFQISTAKNQKLPLIILSHGYKGTPDSLSWFSINLAQHGFIVVAPQHNDAGADEKPFMEHWLRAVDDSFVLKALQQTPDAEHIDFSRVGMAGYSVGTSTGLWLAGGIASTYERNVNPGRQFVPEEEFPDIDSNIADYLLHHTDFNAAKKSYREPMIKSVFLIAPGYGWAFDAKNLKNISIPVFLVAAEKDEMLYPETNAYYFSKYIPNSVMKIFPDVGHFVFLNQTIDISNKNLTADDKKHITFVNQLGKFQYSKTEREQIHKEVGVLAVRFFLETL